MNVSNTPHVNNADLNASIFQQGQDEANDIKAEMDAINAKILSDSQK